MISRLLVATRNPDKLREIQAKLRDMPLEILSLADFPFVAEVEEDQPDLIGNAIKKATQVAEATGLPVLADDTGLEVAALNGALSARYSGSDATYDSNCEKLLREMEKIPEDRRQAHFKTVMCLRTEDALYCVEGVMNGSIGLKKRGQHGFGYDPVFVLMDGRTLAELSLAEKNAVSHRAQALDKMARLLPLLN